jgi:hypothetical protein
MMSRPRFYFRTIMISHISICLEHWKVEKRWEKMLIMMVRVMAMKKCKSLCLSNKKKKLTCLWNSDSDVVW